MILISALLTVKNYKETDHGITHYYMKSPGRTSEGREWSRQQKCQKEPPEARCMCCLHGSDGSSAEAAGLKPRVKQEAVHKEHAYG